MDRLGHQLLAGAVLPRDENGCVGRGHEVDQVVNFPYLLALSKDFPAGEGFFGFPAEPPDLRLAEDQAPDVSGDLGEQGLEEAQILRGVDRFRLRSEEEVPDAILPDDDGKAEPARVALRDPADQIGRASCRERV